MYTELTVNPLFGANPVNTTRGPHWHINQFAGFVLSAGACYSLQLVLHNLSSGTAQVILQHRINNEQPGVETQTQLAPGEFKLVTMPVARDGRVLLVQADRPVAVVSILGGQLSSALGKTQGAPAELRRQGGITLQHHQNGWTGQAPAGGACTLQFPSGSRGAWSYLLELSCSGVVEVHTPAHRTTVTGYCYWLIDETTPQLLHLTAKTATNLAISYQEYADLRTTWQSASGLAIWNV